MRAATGYPYSAGAWPAWTAPDVAIAPNPDFVDVKVFFEPLEAGDFSATITFASDDAFTPERTVSVHGTAHSTGQCQFRILPWPALDFGAVRVGRGAVLGFRFENAGAAECAVKDIHLSNAAGGAFFMPGGALTGGTVPFDTAFSAQIAFRPPAEGTYDGELAITVNNPTTGVARLALRGRGGFPCLTAAPRYLDFGPIRYDCAPRPRSTYVTNQCTLPVLVDDAWIGAGTSDQFSIVTGPMFPQALRPGEGFEVGVTYARAVLGQHFSPLFLQAHGEPAPMVVPLLAETNHEGVQVERFIQGTDRLLDVLFVVSNTTTMERAQQTLAAALPSFIGRARTSGVDTQIGVTTTGLVPRGAVCPGGANGGEAGRLFPVDSSLPRLVSSAAGNAAALAQGLVNVGVCHNLAQGLEAMRSALTGPLVDSVDDPRTPQPNDGNRGLVRDSARLSVVFVSDEDDHSGFEPESYLQLVRALKGPNMSHRVTAYGILPVGGGCTTAGPSAPRIHEVVTKSGGTTLDICAGDYGAFLETLAVRAAGPQRDFRLTAPAAGVGEITVTVDGAAVAPPAWTYDAAANAVLFAGDSVPRPGQIIEVRYRSVCP
jgi:hypothetical protein